MFNHTVIRLLASAILCAFALTVPSAMGQTSRVSVSSTYVQSNGSSAFPSVSADGRFVAFSSAATNLVEGDTNGLDDVFVHDRQTGKTTRVSISSTGAQGDGDSTHPAISADGRFVAFSSAASNLVEGDTNGVLDVFVHDRQSGATGRVSVSSSGSQGNGHSSSPSLSADGRFVAFFSFADNLVEGDWNWASDVFVHDRQAGTTERVSVSSSGNQGNGSSLVPSISPDGRFVAFSSDASNLVEGDWNWASDVFVHDRQAGTTERVSVSSSGNQGNSFSLLASISNEGRFVAFASMASNLVEGDTNGTWDVFVRDRQAGTTQRISVSSFGSEGNGESLLLSISDDGRFVAFSSEAANLVDGDTNDVQDVFVRDRQVTPQVSGHVRTSNGSGISGVSVQATGIGSVSTDAKGHYAITVSDGWSGTVTPSKLGYVFTPSSREYSAVSSDQIGQDFTGAVSERVISGTVLMPDGSGMAGAVVSATGRGSKTTGSNGQYSFTVPNGWSGTVTPSKAGYSFTPASRSYTNLSNDRTGQGFTGALEAPPVANDRPEPPSENEFAVPSHRGHIVIFTHGWTAKLFGSLPEQQAVWEGYEQRLKADRQKLPVVPDYVALYPWWENSFQLWPHDAYAWARWHGRWLGDALGRGNFDHIHLIAHSAGSALIGEVSRSIRALSPDTTIHCTFLDPYTGILPDHDLFGGDADWSDAYFANASDIPKGLRHTTYRRLWHAHNVEVSCLQNQNLDSTHAWPHEWYFGEALQHMIDRQPLPNDTDGSGWYGPALSKLGGNWHRRVDYPPDNAGGSAGLRKIGTPCSGSDGLDGQARPCWFTREQPKVNFMNLIHAGGGQGSATAGTQALEITSTSKDGAWFSLHVAADEAFNLIAADVEFTGPAGSEGFLSVSLDESHAGFVDQRFRLADTKEEFFPVSGENGQPLPPGEYVIGLRLGRHGTGTAAARITNLRLVHSGPSVPRSDFNCDGVVDTLDFVEFLRAYAAGYPEADLTGSGDVGSADLITFIDHFIRGEP
ncbi:MAG: PD40 domain-containing protein [Phycisphaeraceae bacterium]|nr:PD40 domain-containing protein [Phycisphaeraceae bacterium]